MFAFRFKNKIKKTENLVYLDRINNSLVYHGITISDNNVTALNKNILNEIYDLFKINDKCTFIKNNGNYDIYYDYNNDLYHYIKDNKEDLLMFLIRNSKSAVLHNNMLKPHNDKDKFIEITKKGFTIVGNILFIFILLTSNIQDLKLNNDINVENISYATIDGENKTDYITVDNIKNMIYSSNSLSEEEKNFFYNYDLLSDVVPYYTNTSMEFIIKDRLNDFKIVYDKLDDKNAGIYYGTNEICLSDNFIDITLDDSYKSSVLGHEFIHVLQPDIYLYLKETSAEVISSEYYNREAYAYNDACINFKLLVETLGPEIIFRYIFSGDDKEFNEVLKNNLSDTDYKFFITEINKSPFNDNPNHEKITEIIKTLYRNIYKEEITENKDIYDFYNNYIEKNYFKNQDHAITRVVTCDVDKAIKLGIAKYTDLFEYKKEISVDEFLEYTNRWKSTFFYIDNNHDSNEILLSKDDKEIVCYYDLDNMRIIFYIDGEKCECKFNKEELGKLNKEYKFIYRTKTINQKNTGDNKVSDILVSTNDRYKCQGLDTIYSVRSMEERFKGQSIDKTTLQNSKNII